MKVSGIITSMEGFRGTVNEIRYRRAETQGLYLPHRQEYFRGQANADWSVKPGISRDLSDPAMVAQAEEQIMDHFKNEVTARNLQAKVFQHDKPIAYQNDWAWKMQAQHLGFPTRMLDWSLKPEVSLYFAVEDPKWDHVDGQLLVSYIPDGTIKTEEQGVEQYYGVHPRDIKETWFLNPVFYADYRNVTPEIRRARQFGKFTMQPFDLAVTGMELQAPLIRPYTETFDPVIEKYIIPAEFKPDLRLQLIAAGWHGEYLYGNDEHEINVIRDECKSILAGIVADAAK